ncbi:MAG TPA: NAD(P)/FAD-dependent oxidoreductase [Thermomicrobiales bacterium]|nr:NAD(P)/FAD-dependent oxidoreductase [Thermomicrobiales bacterium]
MSIPSNLPRVVVVGAGFGGLHAIQALKNAPVQITVVDRRNHHTFQPLLYQVATASLSPADIAQPIRSILRRQDNIHAVLMAEALSVDPKEQILHTDTGPIPYDYLVLATGSRHSYFGHDDWEPEAPGLKSLEDALEIRRRVLSAFEDAERTEDDVERDRLLTFVVIGGGPTGVELAGALGEISRHTLAREFDRIDPTWARIYLFEGGPRILATFPESLARKATTFLNQVGVQVRTDTLVTEVDADGVVAGGRRFRAATVLWAAGVAASPIGKSLGTALDRAGRIVVNPDLSVPEYPNIFVVGDLAALAGPDGTNYPGVAQVAMQQGRRAGENIRRRLAVELGEPFHYQDKGNLATIGRNRAIADIKGFRLAGFGAWLVWLCIHIFFLIGFQNRLRVALQWAWSYLRFDRGARLITSTGYDQSREIV